MATWRYLGVDRYFGWASENYGRSSGETGKYVLPPSVFVLIHTYFDFEQIYRNVAFGHLHGF